MNEVFEVVYFDPDVFPTAERKTKRVFENELLEMLNRPSVFIIESKEVKTFRIVKQERIVRKEVNTPAEILQMFRENAK